MDAPWFLRPVPAFAVMQLGPLLLWLVIPSDVFRMSLRGAERAPVTLAGLMAFGLLVAGFAAGAWAGARLPVSSGASKARTTRPIVLAAHYAAMALMLFSTAAVLMIVVGSGLNVLAIVLASQANQFTNEVYESSAGAQALIMGRHLVLSSLITWFVLGVWRKPRPLLSVPLILVAAATLYLFTSSRLTIESVLLIAMLFWFTPRPGAPKTSPLLGRLGQAAVVLVLLVVFAGGVWLRSVTSWARLSSTASGLLLAPLYEAVAYVVSPVNYSLAFVADGVAFVRGLGLDNFFFVVYTVLNLPQDISFRQLITWNYNPLLNQIGLVGEWFTIAGPLLWIPAAAYGLLAGALYERFRRRTIAGLLLYPLVLVSLGDTMRGFLLPQNVVASNLLYLGVVLLAISLARVPFRPAPAEVTHAA